jgi:hypothetical protein
MSGWQRNGGHGARICIMGGPAVDLAFPLAKMFLLDEG